MSSAAWKAIERTVAVILGGVRSWDTDHDVLVVTKDVDGDYIGWRSADIAPGSPSGAALLHMSRLGLIQLASVEVKNLKAPTVAQLESYLARNAEKMARDGVTGRNVLVIKRKAGAGKATPYLFVTPLGVPPD